jgi:hypothetical protein
MNDNERKCHVDATIQTKIDVDASLVDLFVGDLIDRLHTNDKLASLICNTCNGVSAGRIAEKYGLHVIELPNEILKEDSWAVTTTYGRVLWSPGA